MGAGMTKLSVVLTSERMLIPDAPSPREAHSTVDLGGGKLLIFGGGSSVQEEAEQYNDVHILDTKQHTWTKVKTKGTPPAARTGQTTALLPGGQLLVFGGCSMDSGYLDDTHILDTNIFTWTQPPVTGSPPTPRDKHTCFSIDSKMYIFGGFGPEPESPPEAEESLKGLDDLEEDGDAWETDDEAGPSGRPDGMDFTWFNDLHVFEVTTREWREVETTGRAPSPRAAAAAAVLPSLQSGPAESARLILFGGRDSAGRQNDLYSLDLRTFDWRQERSSSAVAAAAAVESQGSEGAVAATPDAPAAPAARSFHALAPLVGPGLAAALLNGGVGLKNENFQGLDVLDTRTMEWASVGSLEGTWPSPRGACSVNVVQDSPESNPKLVIFGGSSDWEGGKAGFHNDVFVTDLGPLIKLLTDKASSVGAGKQAQL